ncbi:hypothetical protein RIF29_07657 [Crotalaria pallida]|uniref:Uncharacterized protein n=1 Tax=Crotalaria pallida TaxID=3830 RepID=A0AAN9J760_CROPI
MLPLVGFVPTTTCYSLIKGILISTCMPCLFLFVDFLGDFLVVTISLEQNFLLCSRTLHPFPFPFQVMPGYKNSINKGYQVENQDLILKIPEQNGVEDSIQVNNDDCDM